MMKINKKMFIVYNIILIITILMGVSLYKNNRELKAQNNDLMNENCSMKNELNRTKIEKDSYKMLYDSQENDINDYRILYKKTQASLDDLQNQIYISKEKEKRISRGDYQYKDLSQYAIMTAQEMNDWISKRAPKESPFIGKGDAFLKAGQEQHMDPKVIVAISATESGWGTSQLAKNKGNYFGIEAYNKDPYTSAKSFDGNFESNIYNSVMWIKNNFYNKGKT